MSVTDWTLVAWNVYSKMIVSTITIIIMIILLLIFIFNIRKISDSKTKHITKVLRPLTILAILCILIPNIWRNFDWFGLWYKWNISCDYGLAIGYIIVISHKGCLYSI